MLGKIISKEDIPYCKIIKAPEDHSTELKSKLENAMRLGNAYKSKATIVFQAEDGPKRVETTVWCVTDGFIQLKNNIFIPTRSLLDIEY